MGYKFQFITLAGFHALNLSMFELARGFKKRGMTAYCRLQDEEFRSEHEHGYDAVQHQQFVGTGYFDSVQHAIMSGNASTVALEGSTEAAQFNGRKRGQHAAKEPRAPAPERVPRVRRSIRLDRAIRS
jgi:isocitrate lyase